MKLSKERQKKWKHFIATLKANLPTDKPVIVRTKKIKNDLGYLINERDHYLIVICSTTTWDERVDALIHEYAHALDHEGVKHGVLKERTHSETWGIHYAKCYSLLFDRE